MRPRTTSNRAPMPTSIHPLVMHYVAVVTKPAAATAGPVLSLYHGHVCGPNSDRVSGFLESAPSKTSIEGEVAHGRMGVQSTKSAPGKTLIKGVGAHGFLYVQTGLDFWIPGF